MCKFTPLGFETRVSPYLEAAVSSVNLPRWGLKQLPFVSFLVIEVCKFTPLGFETEGGLKYYCGDGAV